MLTDALSVPAPHAEAPTGQPANPANDGAGTPTTDGSTALAQSIQRASAGAVDQHLSETRKRPDKAARKLGGSAGAPLGNGSGEAPLAEGTPEPLGGVVVAVPAFDEESAKALVEIAVGLLNDGASAIVRAIAKKETGDEKLAEEAAQSVRMADKVESTVKLGAVLCAKKYAVNMAYAPELMLCGGLVIWGGQVTVTAKALRAKGAELRQQAKQQERKAA